MTPAPAAHSLAGQRPRRVHAPPIERRARHMNGTVQRWAIVQGDEDNTDIEDGDGGGSNPKQGCGDNGGYRAS